VCSEHKALINVYCNNIVQSLVSAAKDSVPKIIPNSLKSYWNNELSGLKQISIDMHNLWRLIGSPTSGSIINAHELKLSIIINVLLNKLRLNQNKKDLMKLTPVLLIVTPFVFGNVGRLIITALKLPRQL